MQKNINFGGKLDFLHSLQKINQDFLSHLETPYSEKEECYRLLQERIQNGIPYSSEERAAIIDLAKKIIPLPAKLNPYPELTNLFKECVIGEVHEENRSSISSAANKIDLYLMDVIKSDFLLKLLEGSEKEGMPGQISMGKEVMQEMRYYFSNYKNISQNLDRDALLDLLFFASYLGHDEDVYKIADAIVQKIKPFSLEDILDFFNEMGGRFPVLDVIIQERIWSFVPKNSGEQALGIIRQIKNNLGEQSALINRVALSRCGLSNEILRELVEAFPNIEVLDISYNQLNASAISILTALSNLSVLNFNSNNLRRINPAEMAKLYKLHTLYAESSALWPVDVVAIAELPNLRHLHIASNQLKSRGAVEIARMRNLITLDIGWNHIENNGVAELATLPHLRFLDVRRNDLDAASANDLVKLSRLEVLSVAGNNIRGDGLIVLTNLSNLRIFNIANIQLKIGPWKNALVALSRLSHLESFVIAQNSINDEDIVEIVKIPNLRALYIEQNNLGNASKALLAKIPYVKM